MVGSSLDELYSCVRVESAVFWMTFGSSRLCLSLPHIVFILRFVIIPPDCELLDCVLLYSLFLFVLVLGFI
jgi:hypothetical protein